VRRKVRAIWKFGRDGGYILSSSHALEGDVPLENLLALIEKTQTGL
jgi:uroporphyrinogen decarboxylase